SVEVVGRGVCTPPTLNVGEHAIPSFTMDSVQRIPELLSVVHQPAFTPLGPYRFFLSSPAMLTRATCLLSRRPSRPMQKILPMRVLATLIRVNGAARQFST